MPNLKSVLLAVCAMLTSGLLDAAPLSTVFTYQGSLSDNAVLADADYDFEFQLWSMSSGGVQVGPTILLDDILVSAGLFSVGLDFGATPFIGDDLWLLIRVRDGASTGGFTELLPRQALTPTPYALHSEFVAANAIGAVEIDNNEVQLRVSSTCGPNASIRTIGSDGSVACEVDDVGSGTVSQVNTGSGLTGGPITTTGTVSVDTAQTQSRVTGSCPTGSSIQSISVDGTVVCSAPASVTYTRWGHTDCPLGTTQVYQGVTGGAFYSQTGGGANLLCLSLQPTYNQFSDANNNRALIYGTEYETTGAGIAGLESVNNFEVPCAVCLREGPQVVLMQPGRDVCPTGFQLEYPGYLMSSSNTLERSEYLCVDQGAVGTGSSSNFNGALLYPVEAECGSLPCSPYVQNRELTCSVCSK